MATVWKDFVVTLMAAAILSTGCSTPATRTLVTYSPSSEPATRPSERSDGVYTLLRLRDSQYETVYRARRFSCCECSDVGFSRGGHNQVYAVLGEEKILLESGMYVWQFARTQESSDRDAFLSTAGYVVVITTSVI